MKFLKALPIIGSLVSLYFIITAALSFYADTISLGHASLLIITYGIVLLVSYVAGQQIKTLEKRTRLATKCARKNNQYKYTPSFVDYASSFSVGDPVITSEEYGEGPGYHCYIDKIDKTCIGRPFRIKLVGNESFDWVSFDEIKPDMEVAYEIQ